MMQAFSIQMKKLVFIAMTKLCHQFIVFHHQNCTGIFCFSLHKCVRRLFEKATAIGNVRPNFSGITASFKDIRTLPTMFYSFPLKNYWHQQLQ